MNEGKVINRTYAGIANHSIDLVAAKNPGDRCLALESLVIGGQKADMTAPMLKVIIGDLLEQIASLESKVVELKNSLSVWKEHSALLEAKVKLYNELIMGVAQKFPGETRHETALRYILDRENAPSQSAVNTLAGGEDATESH